MPPAPPATEAELSRMLLLAAATELCILQGRWKAACPVDTEAQMAVLGGCAAAAGLRHTGGSCHTCPAPAATQAHHPGDNK